jgi:3-hydroxybutyryl-CoA dehydrogenase
MGNYGDGMADIRTVGVVGSGIMGGGLAEVAARSGYHVILRSRSATAGSEALEAIDRGLARHEAKGRLEPGERAAITGRISTTTELADFASCDLVIESVVENLAIKRELFAELDRCVPRHAVLATNTSTLPVVELAMATERPNRVCGIHFFNPAPVMELVEVVRPITADDDTIDRAIAFAASCGKQPITVADHAGFVVNALLFPYLNNAIRMLERGTADLESIDAAMTGGCGFPMGPFALLDLVGLDTSLAILDALYEEFRDPNYAAMPLLRRKVSAGHLGRKSGRGFYAY